MRAIVYSGYGSPDVLKCVELDKPTPADDEVLIKVRAASVNAPDWRILSGKPYFLRLMFGLRKPKVRPGVDLAGEVEAVGNSVTRFKPGDAVFGACRGAFSEYVCAKESRLVPKPANVSFEAAAAVAVAAITALQALRDQGRIQQSDKVLIDGASGGVGTFAVQIAKSFGAEVTAVCSTRNVETALSIGADHVIDYTRDDFTKNGLRYDLIIGANAYHSIFDYRRSLSEKGIYVLAGGGWSEIVQGMFVGPLLSLFGSKKMRFFIARIDQSDLVLLKDLLAARKITPVIDGRYPLSDVPKAVRYIVEVHPRGKVVITIGG